MHVAQKSLKLLSVDGLATISVKPQELLVDVLHIHDGNLRILRQMPYHHLLLTELDVKRLRQIFCLLEPHREVHISKNISPQHLDALLLDVSSPHHISGKSLLHGRGQLGGVAGKVSRAQQRTTGPEVAPVGTPERRYSGTLHSPLLPSSPFPVSKDILSSRSRPSPRTGLLQRDKKLLGGGELIVQRVQDVLARHPRPLRPQLRLLRAEHLMPHWCGQGQLHGPGPSAELGCLYCS
mmetsp:Transcript_116030/g.266254  ORF Transcript_116030/g.266254 Transcript_116030/m.266254 type:complete len:237 (+) Transcript_116030:534-1244(+)